MSSQLDPEILAAITAEARQCFLDEDAPEYLQMLGQGLQDRTNPNFTELLRAAHSLKGGAGLACLSSLQNLAHKLEDVIVGIKEGQIAERELAWALVEKGIDEVGYILGQARTVDDAIANPELIIALESLVATIPETSESYASNEDLDPNSNNSNSNNDLIYNTLTVDLENNFVAIEGLELDTPEEVIQAVLSGFAEECVFLAETLDLPWLEEATVPITRAIEETDAVEALLLTQEIIAQLRGEIENYLSNVGNINLRNGTESPTPASAPVENYQLVVDTLNQDLEAICQAIAELALDTPEEIIQEALTGFAEECTFIGETLDLPWLIEAIAPIETLIREADPLEALLRVQELAGEILQQRDLYLEKLLNDNDETVVFNLEDSIPRLEKQEHNKADYEAGSFDFEEDDEEEALSTVMFATPGVPVAEMVAKVKVAAESAKPVVANSQVKIPLTRLQDMTNNVEELILTYSRFGRQQDLLNQANRRLRSLTRQFEPIREQIQNLYDELAISSSDISQRARQVSGDLAVSDQSFDSLEMDHYSDLHTSLQSFQELMLQIQETRTDIDFVDRELAGDIEQTQKNLNTLYSEVTDSRLVPFDLLAKRFVPQIRGLSQRFDKLVDLKIEGSNTPVDQILLEQLQTPLTHLLNNAFDHGIESKYERLAAGKTETASIWLTSELNRNSLVVKIKDDGGGISIEKVYDRGVQRGICPPGKSIKDFQPGEILNWIFEPNFSTAATVSDISGRGMGLDIVLNLIRQLKGQLQLQTDVGLGSTFTITLPLNLSLQSLLLVQLQNQMIAIPHTSILEILPYEELDFIDQAKQNINWHDQLVPVAAASSLFRCPRKPLNIGSGKVGIVLQTAFKPVAILVDGIFKEEKLIIKPFDETIPVPAYLAGCAVLGSGEVIPVILPQGLAENCVSTVSTKVDPITVVNTNSTILIAEDSVATRKMLDKVLTAVGYKVIVCRDGQEALEQTEQYQGRIDLIVSDVEMPRLNGFELLAKVRAQPAFKNTPIIMATSRTGDRHRQEAEKLGATGYLGKPVQPQELIDTVAALLAKK